ncbi:hypothetical protein [Leisingera daeponensis]|uniref:hypothetical protein n=1 Tax=Leisingera daeponensis TaxID=405746 RepID=UPI001C952B49|nr:hypothetical protein [Leisingera daeponensis]MBY6059512.1 hypothetical protein [Leisingera daeponensis]
MGMKAQEIRFDHNANYHLSTRKLREGAVDIELLTERFGYFMELARNRRDLKNSSGEEIRVSGLVRSQVRDVCAAIEKMQQAAHELVAMRGKSFPELRPDTDQ